MSLDLARFDTFADLKILCLGDIMLDAFIKGDVSRISPEAPIPVLSKSTTHTMLGGVGNAACNIKSIGAQVSIISVTGNDSATKTLNEMCASFDSCKLIQDQSRRTTVKSRFIASQQQMLRVDDEDTHPIDEQISNQIIKQLRDVIKDHHVLLISDYGKGVCTPGLIKQCISLAAQHGVPVVIDPKGNDYSIYANADIVTPNKKELELSVGKTLIDDSDIVHAAQQLCQNHNIKNLVITRSADGMTVVSGNAVHHIPTKAKEVCDVSGAGDTVISTIAVCLAAGFNLHDSAQIANAAAGIVVGKFGTATVSTAELLQDLRETKTHMWQSKIICRSTAPGLIAQWRAKGLKIGFTNGCFDLLHPGHIKIVHEAKAQCDKLILGLNSDDSIKRLKGKDRPVQSQDARATILASLQDIDLVVIFDEDTPYELIKAIMPDVLIKGADYTQDQVVGVDIVMENGGRVHLVDLVPNSSTTAMIERAAGQ